MSELINNSGKRKELLKHMILSLHEGIAPEQVKGQLVQLLSRIPYGEVVEVEQELMSEGLPFEEVLKMCDIHSKVLEGHIDQEGSKEISPGHPVDTFINENAELLNVVGQVNALIGDPANLPDDSRMDPFIMKLKGFFNALMDVDKHYLKKEYLLFPFLENYGITGPPKVMWGKHDETREMLRGAIEALDNSAGISRDEAGALIAFVLKPAVEAVADMTIKEEQILFPMSMDRLTDVDWYEIYRQTPDYGFCLYDPQTEWAPADIQAADSDKFDNETIKLASGSFTVKELNAILNMLPVDMTFVDKNDKVKYFSQSRDRIFTRSRAILKRDVRMCHPPSSVHVVNQILDDFKSGRQSQAPFWINLRGMFVHIEYFALRDENGEYLGTLEVSQDLTNARSLEGEQRLLSYAEGEADGKE